MLPKKIAFLHESKGILKELIGNKNYSQIGLLVDENTKKFCYPLVKAQLPEHVLIEIASGEEHKNIETCVYVWEQLTVLAFDRHSLLIILGGGVLGDMGGFCAGTYKRGIDFILLPTTLLAQVDASIGGKLGIDFRHLKNHIGIFQEPVSTVIGSQFLASLPERELRSGFAEVIKHCLISDRKMWDAIRNKSLAEQDWSTLVRHSVEFKYSVTEKDPVENGLRKILNFGHTVGHAAEAYFLSRGNRIFHGEAIAMGMVAEAFIAVKKGLIAQGELDQITVFLTGIFGKIQLPEQASTLLKLMAQDKKNQGKRILMALPEGIGRAVWDIEVSEDLIIEALDFYRTVQI